MELGTIHPVSLRELWLGEATHFTPWLAKNLDVLGNKIGIDLELLSTETAVGDFSADITARDLSTNKLVVVENQYGATDHRHLGQIITYASHLGAGAVVWIAESIRPEHKLAIDFLNQNLKESLRLYAVQASVIRIDESKPAFVLTVVSMPSETISTPPDSETGEHYRSYFQQLIDTLRETYKFTNARIARPQNWYAFASENSKIYKYSTNFCRDGRIRVELYIDRGVVRLSLETPKRDRTATGRRARMGTSRRAPRMSYRGLSRRRNRCRLRNSKRNSKVEHPESLEIQVGVSKLRSAVLLG